MVYAMAFQRHGWGIQYRERRGIVPTGGGALFPGPRKHLEDMLALHPSFLGFCLFLSEAESYRLWFQTASSPNILLPQPLDIETVGLSHYAPFMFSFIFRDLEGIACFTTWDPLCIKPCGFLLTLKTHQTSDFTNASLYE